jgi:hypothetical protein
MTDDDAVSVLVSVNSAIAAARAAFDVAAEIDADQTLLDDLFAAEHALVNIRAALQARSEKP